MKFIHTGDIHYGIHPDPGKPWSDRRGEAINDSLTRIVRACKTGRIDLLLICGNLFHHQPIISDLESVNQLFSSIPDTHIVIIAGDYDYLIPSSSVMTFSWSSNVTYITSDTVAEVSIPELDTSVYGFSSYSSEWPDAQLSEIHPSNRNHASILLSRYEDASKAEGLSDSGFTYCAMGHSHKHVVLTPSISAVCGSPEPLSMLDGGDHGYYLGEIDNKSSKLTSLKFVSTATITYVSLVISVTPASTNSEVISSITDEIKSRGETNIYRFKIRGMRDPGVEFNLDGLKNRFHIAEIIDDSEPKYDFHKLFEEHPSDMVGFFVRKYDSENLSELDKKSLYYGVDALLRTSDERSSS